jgi:hypothetical protein
MVGCRRIPNMREKKGASENLWMRREFVFAVVGCKKLPAKAAPGSCPLGRARSVFCAGVPGNCEIDRSR